MTNSNRKLTLTIYLYVYTYLLCRHLSLGLKCYQCIAHQVETNLDCQQILVNCKKSEKFCSVEIWSEEGEPGVTVNKLCTDEPVIDIPGFATGRSCSTDKCNNMTIHVEFQEEFSGSGGAVNLTAHFVMLSTHIILGVIGAQLLF